MTELNLEEIEARWDEATEGPWVFQPWSAHLLPSGDYAESILMANASSDGELCRGLFDVDGEAIAHARTDVPDLIAEVRRLRADLDAVRALTGPDNESGIISTNALLHTIGTGERLIKAKCMELEAQIERVRGLHRPIDVEFCDTICEACSSRLPNGRFMPTVEYPCPTIQALGEDGE